MYSDNSIQVLPCIGCPIRKSPDLTVACTFPRLIAAYHVLHRLYMPRHPPYALSNLIYTFSIKPIYLQIDNIIWSLIFLLFYFNQPFQKAKFFFCGADRDRTCDPRVANAMLSQLSYSPIKTNEFKLLMWVWVDSNYRPPPYQSGALTDWATNP